MNEVNNETLDVCNNKLIIHDSDIITPHHVILRAELQTSSGDTFPQYMEVQAECEVCINSDDLNDAWCVFFIHKMMEIGGTFDIEGQGALSESLLMNLERYVEAWNRWMPNDFQRIKLNPSKVRDDSTTKLTNKGISCFSGGLDACCTLLRHRKALMPTKSLDIEACVMFQGADIFENNNDHFDKAFQKSLELTRDLGVQKLYRIKTNFRELNMDYEMTYHTMLMGGLRLFTSSYSYFITASEGSYESFAYPWASNPITDHFLSSHGKEAFTDGMGMDRTEKAGVVSQWPLAMRLMRCCWEGVDQSGNCGVCTKCRLTIMNFMAMKVNREDIQCMPIHGELTDVTHIEFNRPFRILYAQEIIKHAKINGLGEQVWVKELEQRLDEKLAPKKKKKKNIFRRMFRS